MSEAPEAITLVRTEYEVCQSPIHARTAFVHYAAAAVNGLCATRNPRSKEDVEEIITMAHFIANRMIEGPLPPAVEETV